MGIEHRDNDLRPPHNPREIILMRHESLGREQEMSLIHKYDIRYIVSIFFSECASLQNIIGFSQSPCTTRF